MNKEESKSEKKQVYVEPGVIVTYEKDELENAINPEGYGAIFASTELIVPVN